MTRPDKVLAKLSEHALYNALMLAKAGVYVFPMGLTNPRRDVGGGVKADKVYHPFRWSTNATTDPERIVELFDLYPGSFVGIATGPSNLVVVDEDDLASIPAAKLDMPETHDYPTLRLGRHSLYRSPRSRAIKTQSGGTTTVDGVRLEGVDVRATGGMLVYYGPKLEAPPTFAKAPKWVLVEATSTGVKVAPDLKLTEWLESLRPGKMTDRTRAIVKGVPIDGMSHGQMLAVQNDLARLGANGATGIPKAVAQARERYLRNHPKHAKAWDDAMLDAAQTFGKPLPAAAILTRPSEPKSKAAKGKGKGKGELKPAKAPKPPRTAPDDFFDRITGLQSATLAHVVNWDGLIGLGVDGRFWEYAGGVWLPNDDIVRERVVALLGDRYRREHTGVARDVVATLAQTPRITGEPHAELINVRNGMLDWRTGELHPHAPEYLSTVQLAVEYRPGARHPLFDKWLELVCGPDNGDLAVTLWELVAYSCYNGNPFQKAAMLHGVANGGKSTFIELVERIVGSRNVASLTPAQMEERFPPALLLGKLINVQGEYEGKRLQSTNAFKSIVAGDRVEAEHKGKAGFSFRPWAFHIFAGNEFDLTSDTTEGYYRRWLTLNFTRRVRELIDWPYEAFMAEADAVFSTAVGRLPELLEAGEFTRTAHMAEAEAMLRRETDIAATWLDDDDHVIEWDPSSNVRTQRSHLYQVYATWTAQSGHRALAAQSLYKRLARLGYEAFKLRGVWHIRGIAVDSKPLGLIYEPSADERSGS